MSFPSIARGLVCVDSNPQDSSYGDSSSSREAHIIVQLVVQICLAAANPNYGDTAYYIRYMFHSQFSISCDMFTLIVILESRLG